MLADRGLKEDNKQNVEDDLDIMEDDRDIMEDVQNHTVAGESPVGMEGGLYTEYERRPRYYRRWRNNFRKFIIIIMKWLVLLLTP